MVGAAFPDCIQVSSFLLQVEEEEQKDLLELSMVSQAGVRCTGTMGRDYVPERKSSTCGCGGKVQGKVGRCRALKFVLYSPSLLLEVCGNLQSHWALLEVGRPP